MALCRAIVAAVMIEVCRTIFGNRGSGKSEGLKIDLLRIAAEGRYAVLVLDKPGKLAREMVGHLSENGFEKRTLYEKASDFGRYLRWRFGNQVDPAGPAGRNALEIEVERFGQIFLSKRKLRSAEDRPYTKEYLDAACGVFLSQPEPLPLHRILDVFRPGSQGFRELIGNARDKDSAIAFIEAANRAARNRVQFEIETGAARRLLKIVTSPVLDLRHGDGIDWEEILEKKMQVYFDLSGVKYEAARALGIAASHAVIDACRLHYERTGEAIPVVICYEECGIMEFLTPLAVDFAREHRKAGLAIWASSQTIRDFDEETFEQFLGLADEHHWYFLASGVERAAADLANPTFNPMEVHYTRDRIVTDSYDEVKTVSKGTSRGPDGKTRTDERVGITYRPRTRIVVEEYFKSPQLHEQEFRTWLAQLKTGERYVRDRDGVRKEKLTMLGEPCPLGLTPIRTNKAIERIRSSLHFSQMDCAECDGKTSDVNSIAGSASTPAPSNNSSTSSPASTQQKSTSPKRSGREGSTSSGGSCGTNKKAADQETSTPADQSGKTAFGMNWQEP